MSVVAPPEGAALPSGFWETLDWNEARAADADSFRGMLEAANRETNLVGAATLPQFWTRHFLDSAQLLWFEREAVRWADLGSGAGLPGLVLAILLKGREGARVDLVESMAKRCRFLQSVVDRLDLPAMVRHGRAEDFHLQVEVVTARACAPLDRLLDFAAPFMGLGARGLFLKGADAQAEIDAARGRWRFETKCETSLSDPRGRLLSIRNLTRGPRR
ncbi:MAG: 16S rRNA (guanine(527)-N(7))-methyltransferase RsmG [Caulobacteraceae bacterium]|nr:16S rRNA (guanine(527)-N(7))-methyltransferase RsmG [Caulobacteraceae bacterium]